MRALSKSGAVKESTIEDEILRLKKAAHYLMVDYKGYLSGGLLRKERDNLMALRLFQNVLLLKEGDLESEIAGFKCKFVSYKLKYEVHGRLKYGGKGSERRQEWEAETSILLNQVERLIKGRVIPEVDKLYKYLAKKAMSWCEYTSPEMSRVTIQMYEYMLVRKKRFYISDFSKKVFLSLKEKSPFLNFSNLVKNIEKNPTGYRGLGCLDDPDPKKRLRLINAFFEKFSNHPHPYIRYIALDYKAKYLLREKDPECVIYYKKTLSSYPTLYPFFKKHKLTFWGLDSALASFKKFKEPYIDILRVLWKSILSDDYSNIKLLRADTYPYLLKRLDELKLYDEGLRYANAWDRWRKHLDSYWAEHFRRKLDTKIINPNLFMKNTRVCGIAGEKLWVVKAKRLSLYSPDSGELKDLEIGAIGTLTNMASTKKFVMLTTRRDGIFFFDHKGKLLRRIKKGDKNFPQGKCPALVSYKGSFYGLFLGNNQGVLIKWNFPNKSYEIIAPKTREDRPSFKDIDHAIRGEVKIKTNEYGITIVSNFKAGVSIFNPEGKQVIQRLSRGVAEKLYQGLPLNLSSHRDFQITTPYLQNSIYTWCGSRDGFFQVNNETGIIEYLIFEKGLKVSSLFIFKNNLYVNSANGVYRFDISDPVKGAVPIDNKHK